MRGNHFIYLCLDGGQLLGGRLRRQLIVALAFLPLDMGIAGTRTAEHFHHCSVQNMFGRVHGRILLFVMSVELRLFHIDVGIIFCISNRYHFLSR